MSTVNSILFVCLGNICRSPTAEAVFKAKAKKRGIQVQSDSAGTMAYHQGSSSDKRVRVAGERRGYDFSGIIARGIEDKDFADFDLILAADNQNLQDLRSRCPLEFQHKLALILSFADADYSEVPDPYYGGEQGFELVLDLLEISCDNLLDKLSASVR
ncbi:low molecular weight protein-tyrosine-phosphatase [Shewanella sp. Isolate11]|uniref:low molecular weight protein-tyrosine-phosphatase n=1 Tax=Shewanella sp. Isolate11 TaxID=2908530 RepID=UPI001EFE2101|nr:low molecular weight protein-tyrosine-phosphatase [Shewanella sp. Isolate11]MCG9696987.1 low molecular weight phosphotyrosine protein phosphatase [Shewanella sp. Isolate11]